MNKEKMSEDELAMARADDETAIECGLRPITNIAFTELVMEKGQLVAQFNDAETYTLDELQFTIDQLAIDSYRNRELERGRNKLILAVKRKI